MVTVVITGCCQPDEVNLRLYLIHIRQTEVLFDVNNYHAPPVCSCSGAALSGYMKECFSSILLYIFSESKDISCI